MLRTLAAGLLFFAFPAFAEDIFESEKTGYSLIYSDDWELKTSADAPDNIALNCTLPICEKTIRATISAGYDYHYKNDKPSDLFSRMYPQNLTYLAKQTTGTIGKLKVLKESKRARIGNTEGFMGTFQLTYNDGRMRHLIYGIVLNKGYIYHIQFLSPTIPNPTIQAIADTFFDGFQVNE